MWAWEILQVHLLLFLNVWDAMLQILQISLTGGKLQVMLLFFSVNWKQVHITAQIV
jgi:hypothetical protein